MKAKMAITAALATLVTVGGVYASWSFAENSASSATTTVNVAMTGLTAASEKGTLVVKDTGYTLAVDDADNNHLPDIMKDGTITITFTASPDASDEVKANGIDVKLSFSYAPNPQVSNAPASLEEWVYEGTQIFEITNNEMNPIHLAKESAVKSGNVFTWTLDMDTVGIDLTDDMEAVSIDTLEKYNALNAILATGHFVATVSECTTIHNV